MAGSATAAVRFKDTNRGINTNDIPALSSIQAKVGMLEGTALYHENGYYETIDLIASDLTQLNQINKPRLVNFQKQHWLPYYRKNMGIAKS